MVRQDKIAYFTTFFEGEGWSVLYPKIDPLESLINTVLSDLIDQNKASVVLLSKYQTWDKVAQSSIQEIKNTIQSVKFYDHKIQTLIGVLHWAKQTFGEYSLQKLSEWSSENIINELTSIDMIEINSISVMLCETLERDIFPVDTEIQRTIARMGIVQRGLSLNETFDLINSYIPIGRDYFLFRNLKRFAREICFVDNPNCKDCVLREHCDFHLKKNDWSEM
ncbi:MAG: hypothetical protein ISR90_03020 [Candidatus Marinimicrobia bacterium]|nr:hypothetical protein [Candidatus Neomarinimicrobiota bacterium]MBL7023012.1 hypothetical protein [Candidatus Neomarinimicrobiota bacterium]MBL7109652.1 hypothetical protein [Candidatus Neomarinimicrobiota bacterium]